MDLQKRRQEVLEHNKLAEKTRGSGWHLADLGVEEREKAGQAPLSERPIIFQDNDLIHVLAADLPPIKAGIQQFLDKLETAHQKAKENNWGEPDLLHHGLNYQAQAVRYARVALAAQDGLTLPTQQWNYVNELLGYANVHVVSATAEVQSYDD